MNPKWKSDALNKIQSTFREIFLDDSLFIYETTTPLDIEEWDSLAHVSILTAIEKKFNIHITADDMAAVQDVASLLKILEKNSDNQ